MNVEIAANSFDMPTIYNDILLYKMKELINWKIFEVAKLENGLGLQK